MRSPLLLLLALVACGPVHRTIARTVAQPSDTCTPHTARCVAGRPAACVLMDDARWELSASVEPCLHGCVEPSPGNARCARPDESADGGAP